MNKIFLDTDVLLDVVFDRKPFSEPASRLLALCEKSLIHGHTSALILANCYYIISAKIEKATATRVVSKYREFLTILDFTNKEIGESIQSGFSDLEDGIQHFIAINNSVNTIITRNIEDYKKASINVMTPEQYLNLDKIRKLIVGNVD